ncbi:hypothetical protein DUNSADRAFT_2316 [Dunaliella salina]|uniref:Guanylate cyclase domain-containing protein n=1 Tax=Dunaliella salina TaxID=3046 RepID=A0ABQ7FWF7_DUNSA|nr:hypothetical protein DUNSADRAFT_2316 [Dunaliella salina]|eukprot:KAF5826700.1 hypothetical protein DUNSADRAFT_2316 [Dunaliella salina]
MAMLRGLCKEYDKRAAEMGLYTVDVIGDCYMCAANLIKPLPHHVSATVGFAQSILQVANATLTPLGTPLRIRIGIHSGPAMSGVIGVHRLKFTLVGDTVNVASRMESTAVPNTIQLSKDAYKQLQREQLAILSEAAEEQGFERGGFADQEMLSQASEEDGHAGHAFVWGNSAPPCLVDSMPKERWEDSAELGGLLGSRSVNQSSTELAAVAELHHWPEFPATAAQALMGPVAPVLRHSSMEQAAQQCPGTAAQAPVTPEPRHSSTETAAQAQQHQWQQEQVPLHYEDEDEHAVPQQQQQPQQQQGCHLQPWVHRKNGQDQLQQPQSIREQSCHLSQGGAASCAAMPAEQSSCTFAERPLSTGLYAEQPQSSSLYAEQSGHASQLGGPEHMPAHPSCLLQAWRPGRFLYCHQTPDTRHPAQVAGHHPCGWGHGTTRRGGGDQGLGCSSSPDHGQAYISSLDQGLRCPDGQVGGPACCLKCSMKRTWLVRELNIKGKGVMKAYTYTGPCHHPRQEPN